MSTPKSVDPRLSRTWRRGGIEASETPGESTRAARVVKLTLAAGVAVLVVVGALTLTNAPPRVVRVGERTAGLGPFTTRNFGACQANEVLPAGVTAIRLSLVGLYGASVHVRALSGSRHVLAEGSRGADWTGSSVTLPVKPLSHTASHVTLCFDIKPNSELIYTAGTPTPEREMAITNTGQQLGGRVGVEYLASGRGSWWSRILGVARHMGIGHALSGTWVTLLIAALMAAAGLLAVRLASRESRPIERSEPVRPAGLGHASVDGAGAFVQNPPEPASAPRSRIGRAWVRLRSSRPATGVGARLGRVPTAAWVCASIAFLNTSAWALIVPPFQGKDEADHFAYVAQLAENGTLPENGPGSGTYSPQEANVLRGLHYGTIVHSPRTPAISSVAEQRTLTADVDAGASLQGPRTVGIATSEPPLYYALQTIPYAVGSGNILTQLQLMRLLGALFGALTALFAFLFLREALPGLPWAATVGALCVALAPLLAFVSGSVNPDTMLFAVAAAVFFCLARAFRRGLTRRLAIALGVLVAVGFLTKLNFVGFAFGVFVGLVVLAVREARVRGLGALRSPAIAAGIGILPVLLYALRNVLSSRPTFGLVSGGSGLLATTSLFHELSYMWQMYLPRLPGMTHYFRGVATYKDIWFDRSVGIYGWLDTMFPVWVDTVALVPAAVVALLCGRELFVRRAALRARLPELGVYAAIAVGVLGMIGAASYLSDVVGHQYAFGEPRYLLPLVPLLGAVLTLAVRGAGRRWAPVIGAALVVLLFGHDILSQLQTIARYYG